MMTPATSLIPRCMLFCNVKLSSFSEKMDSISPPSLLNLGWPWDLLWSIECGRSDNGSWMSTLTFLMPCDSHVRKARLVSLRTMDHTERGSLCPSSQTSSTEAPDTGLRPHGPGGNWLFLYSPPPYLPTNSSIWPQVRPAEELPGWALPKLKNMNK